MSFPVARYSDVTIAGEVLAGPGAPTVLAGGRCVAVTGDATFGSGSAGVVLVGSPTVLAMGRPVARATSRVANGPASDPGHVSTILGSPAVGVFVP